jgi:hypothetical protein
MCTAAITAAGPVAAAVTVQPVEPLLALEQEWSGRLHYANIEQPGDTDEERQPAFDALYAVELEIRKTPAQSFAGLAVQAAALCSQGEISSSDLTGGDWTGRINCYWRPSGMPSVWRGTHHERQNLHWP